MKIVDVQQGTPEWHAARCGRATASEFSSILAKGQGKTRASYLRQVVAERLTGMPVETYRNTIMDRGHNLEPMGRAAYEIDRGVLVDQVGLILHDSIMVSTSPDFLVGLKGGGEIKSVLPTTQLDTLLEGVVPTEHKAQIQGNLWISEREWWDFVSYCPEMPTPEMRLFIRRVYRDEPYIKNLEIEVMRFLEEVDQTIEKLHGLAPSRANAEMAEEVPL